MPRKELEDKLMEDNIKILSEDTPTFRFILLMKVLQLESKISGLGCVANAETVAKHEKEFQDIKDFNGKLDKKIDLLAKDNENILKAVDKLEISKEENAKAIGTVDRSVFEIQTEKKTALLVIGVILSNLIAIAGIVVAVWAVRLENKKQAEVEKQHKYEIVRSTNEDLN